jgi:hypothetical protein
MSHFDLYYAYLARCERDNWINDVDPHHYKMEWNHTLPQCIFGDLPFGQWLTLKQHAIASALQTLAFDRCTLCAWHKQHVPVRLWDLCLPLFLVKATKAGSIAGRKNVESGHILQIRTPEGSRQGGETQGRKNVENKTGMFKRSFEELSETSKKTQAKRYMCTVTGHISNGQGLTKYQRKHGIETSNRIELK